MVQMNRHGKAYIIKHEIERGSGLDIWTVEKRIAPNAWTVVYYGDDYEDCVNWVENE